MKKLDSIDEVLFYLKESEIVFIFMERKRTFFCLKNDKVSVRGENSSYIISLEMFLELYQSYPFYLFEQKKEEIEIDKEKDEEYYRLWHK